MKVGFIGAGGIAGRHLRSLAPEPDIEIVGHADQSLERAEAAAERWGGRAYGSQAELLEREAPDAVWVCVPPAFHGDIERDLIERGQPFFVEKPLANDRETPERIAEAIARAGLIVGVGYQFRAMDNMPELREVLAANPARLASGVWLGSTPDTPWWQRQEISGGQIVEQATHLFDVSRFLLGDATVLSAVATRPPRPAYPDMDVASVNAALLRYEGGLPGTFAVTCLLEHTATVHLDLVCDGMLITFTGERVTYDDGKERREVPVGNDPFLTEDRAFLAAVQAQDPSLVVCDYAEALATHRLCCDVRDAAEGED